MHRRFVVVLTLSIIAAVAPTPTRGEEHQNVARGWSAQGSFLVGDVDRISTFNGGLSISIPLATRFPINHLSYQLSLNYESHVWDTLVWENNNPAWVQKFASHTSNAGLGWYVGFGKLYPAGTWGTFNGVKFPKITFYLAPDGSRSDFYEQLHTSDADSAPDNVSYTRNGTYLRLTQQSTNYQLEFPDGTIQYFDLTGELTSIRDRFGNLVTLTYDLPTNRTDIYDGVRTQKIYWQNEAFDGNTVRMVDRIEFSGFGGAVVTYDFQYAYLAVSRECTDTYPGNVDSITVPVLSAVVTPDTDGSTYARYAMPNYLTSEAQTCARGVIKRLELPTGGAVEWDWRNYVYPQESDHFQVFSTVGGVGARRTKANDGTTEGEWTYSPALAHLGLASGGGNAYRDEITTVTRPSGDKTEFYFSVWPFLDPPTSGAPAFASDYGLPFTRGTSIATSPASYLSSIDYDCIGASCTAKRSTYVAYEQDAVPLTFPEDNMNTNRRSKFERTLFQDDGTHYAEVSRSDFDGLGHYRTQALGGDFASGNSHTTTTRFNPLRGTYPGSFTQLATTSPWLVNLFDRVDQIETDTSRVEYSFDGTTGFLSCVRTLAAGTARGTHDLLASFSAGLNGNVASEKYFGADWQTLATTGACTDSGSLTPSYQLNHTYQNGARSKTVYQGIAAPVLDLVIDAPSGLPSTTKDSAGFATTLDYDAMYRLKSETPSDSSAFTRYTYYPIGYPVSVDVNKCVAASNCVGTDKLTRETYQFDSFGRIYKEKRLLSTGVLATRLTKYDNEGRKLRVGEWVDDTTIVNENTVPSTVYSNYDAFNRPGTITGADGSAVTLTYAGVRVVNRTAAIATGVLPGGTGQAAETSQMTTEIYDRQGRLYEVTEPSKTVGTAFSSVNTFYGYDEVGHLTRVCQDSTNGVSCVQQRLFNYDNRGFLTSETHPEKTAAVTYSSYDPRGHAQTRTDGGISINFELDAAERLVTVRDTGPGFTACGQPGPKCYRSLTYDTAVGLGGGKVAISKTWTYWSVAGTPNTEKVTETYQYQGLGGKVSHRLTAVYNNAVLLHSFNQDYAFRDFGALASLDYPQMNSLPSPRSISLGYKYGFLTGAQPYTGTVPLQASGRGITYHPNQMLSQLAYGNGVLETIAIDSTAMRRPTSISYSGILSGPTWSSGTYAYDGSGNIKAIGSDRFSYDGVGRLDQSKVFAGSTQTQDYTYDPYGNLTNTTTNGVGVGSAADPATNRLLSQTYDGRGNQTGYNGAVYVYDELNRMLEMRNGTQDWFFLYDGADERLASYCVNAGCGVGTIRWTVRGLDQQILREYIEGGGNTLSVLNDYVYANGQLLASETPAGVRYFHPDHLGTPRLVTDGSGNGLVAHTYFPYGQEATSPTGDAQRLKFTAQERDLFATTGANPAADDLDYFHARVRSPLVGRFLSVDPISQSVLARRSPQAWNRYAYAAGNPIRYVDPTGRAIEDETQTETCDSGIFCEIRKWLSSLLAKLAPPPKPSAEDKGAEALNEEYGEIKEHPTELVGAFQRGLNEATSDVGAVLGTAAAVAGTDAAATRVSEIIAPGGRLLGKAGRGSKVREVVGGVTEAESLFAELSRGGRVVDNATYPGTLVEVSPGNFVGLRSASKSGPPTIDVNISGLRLRELKFVGGQP
jgi:RHS repeat-associated protein